MSGTLIVSTPKSAMHALAFQGILPSGSFPQIRDMLRAKFGDEYVLLFAEPAENAASGTIDWYSPVQGQPRPLSALAPEQAALVRERLAHMGGEILRYAEELALSPDPLKVTRGNILRLSLSYPGDDALFVVGDQPVFTCWGFGPGTPGVEPANLSRLAVPPAATAADGATPPPPPPPPSVTPGPVAGARAGCLSRLLPFLLPLALLGLLLFVLFSSFGGLPAVGGHALFHFSGPEFLAAPPSRQGEIDALMAELPALLEKAQTHAALCRPAQTARPAPDPKRQLVIPENARNTEFLAGRWLCDTGLANKRTGEAVAFEFSFDSQGKGRGIVHERGDQCVGEATAQVRDGALLIALGPQHCRASSVDYAAVRIECRNATGRETLCMGVNDDGSTWDADFRRVR